jgi:ABC-type glycerol-3-phosphate transport system permease component
LTSSAHEEAGGGFELPADALGKRIFGRMSLAPLRQPRILGIALLQLSVAFLFLIPIIWMYVAAFRPDADIGTGRLFPHALTLVNFRHLFADPTVVRGFVNSLIVASVSAAVSTTAATFAAYSIARFRYRGRAGVILVIVIAQLVPPLTLLVPIVIGMQKLHLTNSLVGLTIVYFFIGLPIAVVILSNYIADIPRALEEAALVDGATRARALKDVMLPILRPAISAVYAFSFILAWGEYLLALSLQTSDNEKTLPLVMQGLFDEFTVSVGEVMAFGVFISLPVAVLFMLIQRNFVGNLVAGGVKE